ncbi:MAG: HAMP domain-containing sensor histidine kinase [Lachnospiraceae bacterium]
MKHSLTRQISLIFIGLMLSILALCWILNSTLLEGFYIQNKQDTLIDGYGVINEAIQTNAIGTDDFGISMERISSNGNIMMIVINSKGSVIASTVNDTELLRTQLMDLLFNSYVGKSVVLEETKDYRIQKIRDTRLNSDYLILWGNLEDGNLILMRTPLASIKESVALSNQFLTYIGVLAIILSFFIIFFVSKKITRPILRLASISQKMAALDFEAKYENRGKGRNEIDILGEHINTLSENLETTISELKSANNELLQDNQRKTEIDEMRKDFLSNISHELKTPLALIQGYAEGLEECVNDDDESRQFYCDVIMDEAGKMNDMVKKLLTLNQIEFGSNGVVMERFDLTEVMSGVLNVSSLLMKQNNIQLLFNQTTPIYVWAEEYKVEEVFTNYVNNAIHHAEGEKNIEVKIEEKEKKVRVSVFNSGKPIPETDLERIWEKFYKVDKARTREYGGSGIGLSIVKAIMNSFHQECGVINYKDGVLFWFELETGSAEN